MVAPFRIEPLDAGVQEVARRSQDFRNYLDRLFKMIPAEVVVLYLAGSGIIPPDPPSIPDHSPLGKVGTHAIAITTWAIVCFLGLLAVRIKYTADPAKGKPTQWTAVSISAVAFIIWVYTLGGPFADFGIHVPWIGSLLVLAWTFFVPIFYPGEGKPKARRTRE